MQHDLRYHGESTRYDNKAIYLRKSELEGHHRHDDLHSTLMEINHFVVISDRLTTKKFSKGRGLHSLASKYYDGFAYTLMEINTASLSYPVDSLQRTSPMAGDHTRS